MKIVVVGGGRPTPAIAARLDAVHAATPITLVIAGPDAEAAIRWAQARGVRVFAKPADWDRADMPKHMKPTAFLALDNKPASVAVRARARAAGLTEKS